jgi:hypothetical protein
VAYVFDRLERKVDVIGGGFFRRLWIAPENLRGDSEMLLLA